MSVIKYAYLTGQIIGQSNIVVLKVKGFNGD